MRYYVYELKVDNGELLASIGGAYAPWPEEYQRAHSPDKVSASLVDAVACRLPLT